MFRVLLGVEYLENEDIDTTQPEETLDQYNTTCDLHHAVTALFDY